MLELETAMAMFISFVIATITAMVAVWAVWRRASARELEDLKRDGRFCSFSHAAEQVKAGVGYLAINRTNLSGKVWWVQDNAGAIDAGTLSNRCSVRTDFQGSLSELAEAVPPERIIEVSGVIRG